MSSVDLDAVITAGQEAQLLGYTEADCPYDPSSREGHYYSLRLLLLCCKIRGAI